MIKEGKKEKPLYRQEMSTITILICSKNPIISISFLKTKKIYTYNTCSCFKKSNIRELN